jgi:mRNA-degrading endonuclease RelE of RelBE toxin-antitoxin system
VRYRVVRHRKAATEFFQLPPNVRAIYERAIRKMAIDPFASGPGHDITQLSPPKGIVSPVWSLKVGGFRMFYVVDGDLVKIGGFGARPGFYRKLARVKELIRDR